MIPLNWLKSFFSRRSWPKPSGGEAPKLRSVCIPLLIGECVVDVNYMASDGGRRAQRFFIDRDGRVTRGDSSTLMVGVPPSRFLPDVDRPPPLGDQRCGYVIPPGTPPKFDTDSKMLADCETRGEDESDRAMQPYRPFIAPETSVGTVPAGLLAPGLGVTPRSDAVRLGREINAARKVDLVGGARALIEAVKHVVVGFETPCHSVRVELRDPVLIHERDWTVGWKGVACPDCAKTYTVGYRSTSLSFQGYVRQGWTEERDDSSPVA